MNPHLIVVPDGCPTWSEGQVDVMTWSDLLRGTTTLIKGRKTISVLPCRFHHGPGMRDLHQVIKDIDAAVCHGATFVFLRPPVPDAPTGGEGQGALRDRTEDIVLAFGDDDLPYPSNVRRSTAGPVVHAGLPQDLSEALRDWLSRCAPDYSIPFFGPPESLLPLLVYDPGPPWPMTDLVTAAHTRPHGSGRKVLLPAPGSEPSAGDAHALLELLTLVDRVARPSAPGKKPMGRPKKDDSQPARIRDYLIKNPGDHRLAALDHVPELKDIKNVRYAASKAVSEWPEVVERGKDKDGDRVYRRIERELDDPESRKST